jgi:hypothetical protein
MSRKLGFDFMCPLVTDMVQTDPSQRPNTNEAVQWLNEIKLAASAVGSFAPGYVASDLSVVYDILHWLRCIKLIITRAPAVVAPSR